MNPLKRFDATLQKAAVSSQSFSWALLRILGSAMFLTHGWPKLFGQDPQPFLFSQGGMDFFGINIGVNTLWIAGVIELFGGLLLLAGLFTRQVAALAALLMVMAYLTAHPAWFPTLNNGELATLYFLVFLCIFAYGPGRFSLDYRLFGRT